MMKSQILKCSNALYFVIRHAEYVYESITIQSNAAATWRLFSMNLIPQCFTVEVDDN